MCQIPKRPFEGGSLDGQLAGGDARPRQVPEGVLPAGGNRQLRRGSNWLKTVCCRPPVAAQMLAVWKHGEEKGRPNCVGATSTGHPPGRRQVPPIAGTGGSSLKAFSNRFRGHGSGRESLSFGTDPAPEGKVRGTLLKTYSEKILRSFPGSGGGATGSCCPSLPLNQLPAKGALLLFLFSLFFPGSALGCDSRRGVSSWFRVSGARPWVFKAWTG